MIDLIIAFTAGFICAGHIMTHLNAKLIKEQGALIEDYAKFIRRLAEKKGAQHES